MSERAVACRHPSSQILAGTVVKSDQDFGVRQQEYQLRPRRDLVSKSFSQNIPVWEPPNCPQAVGVPVNKGPTIDCPDVHGDRTTTCAHV
jgi:hypothetical protein